MDRNHKLIFRNKIFRIAGLLIASGLVFGTPAKSAPITATLTGTIAYINGDTSAAIGADLVGIVAVGDSAFASLQFDPSLAVLDSDFGHTKVYTGSILSLSVNLKGSVITMAYDPGAGSSFNNTWVSDNSNGKFEPIDFDNNGTTGSITGTIVHANDPIYLSDWQPTSISIFFSMVADNTIVPSAPDIIGGELHYSAALGPGSSQTSYIGFSFTSVEFSPQSAVPVPTALPLFASGLGVLGLIGYRRKRKTKALAV
jgi:hypothetical protein